MASSSIAYLDGNYRSILFKGFHYLPERSTDGWVYWLPRYILKNTSLKLYFITNEKELLFLDKNELLHPVTRAEIGSVDLFFGRTVNSFDPADTLIRSAKKKIVYPIKSNLPDFYNGHDIAIVEDKSFIKPIPDHDRQFFFYNRTKKESYLLYPAAFYKLKGQLKFAKRVSRRMLGGRKVIFCGSIKSQSYADECFSMLRRKGIDFEFLDKVSKQELGDLYRKAALTLFFSSGDYNPRVFYESMACGTPCLLSKSVALAESLEPFASRTSRLMMNRNIRKSLSYPESLSRKLHEHAATLTEDTCYENLFRQALDLKRNP